ncbi:hypothetical protein SEA_RUTHY_56 [Gordonia phage Ruthy]|uniref:Uncharacterized protein n=1 Tax=Gordonia phage Ruthy TaxID=2250323 RepID=A0A345L5G7_9CAUD|nr:hypothetical protein HOT73_gp56 [Gordonia phage Ruthy]AXH50519.1 hypothetical protein SEA_RUTHY_56 [Gordonia phage Ruthy]
MSDEHDRLIDQAAKVICDDETPPGPGFAQWERLTNVGKETYRRSARALAAAGMLRSPDDVVDAEVIDHTDPDQLRHAAAIIEGVGTTDVEGSGPGEFYTSAAILRALAEKLDAKKTVLAQALDAYERVVLAAPDATMTEVHPRAIRAVVELLREGA